MRKCEESPLIKPESSAELTEPAEDIDVVPTFLMEELLLWIRARYRISTLPAETVIGGVSRGGLAAICGARTSRAVFDGGPAAIGAVDQRELVMNAFNAKWIVASAL